MLGATQYQEFVLGIDRLFTGRFFFLLIMKLYSTLECFQIRSAIIFYFFFSFKPWLVVFVYLLFSRQLCRFQDPDRLPGQGVLQGRRAGIGGQASGRGGLGGRGVLRALDEEGLRQAPADDPLGWDGFICWHHAGADRAQTWSRPIHSKHSEVSLFSSLPFWLARLNIP